MVAIKGPGWRLAPCLVELFNEADRRDPTRSRASDGSIGDTAHASRVSDHNPADGWVTAADIDDDNDQPSPGVHLLRQHLVASRDPRVKYLIHERTIWKAYANRGLPAWTPQVYDGLNAHKKHLHISVWNTTAARNDLRPWWPEEDDMADPAIVAQLKRIEARGNTNAKALATLTGIVKALATDVPDNLADELDELRRNLRRDLQADGVPADQIEG